MADLERYWNQYGKKEVEREDFDPRKQVHTDLLWKEIHRCIHSRKKLKILDVGAGPGRFPIPLAEAGHQVVHLDISAEMIKIAKLRIKSQFQ